MPYKVRPPHIPTNLKTHFSWDGINPLCWTNQAKGNYEVILTTPAP